MDECRGCPFPCASLSHYIQLPAFIRLCLLWQCGTQPASVRWVSFTVPWGITRSQWASVTLPSLLCWLTSTAYQWRASMTVRGAWGAFAIFKYLQCKWNVWINRYLYKERMRARVLTPVLYVCPILGLFFHLSMLSQKITRGEAPTDKDERQTLSAWLWADVENSFLWWKCWSLVLLSLSYRPRVWISLFDKCLYTNGYECFSSVLLGVGLPLIPDRLFWPKTPLNPGERRRLSFLAEAFSGFQQNV